MYSDQFGITLMDEMSYKLRFNGRIIQGKNERAPVDQEVVCAYSITFEASHAVGNAVQQV